MALSVRDFAITGGGVYFGRECLRRCYMDRAITGFKVDLVWIFRSGAEYHIDIAVAGLSLYVTGRIVTGHIAVAGTRGDWPGSAICR